MPKQIDAWQFDGDNWGEIQYIVGERPVKDNPDFYIKNFDDVREYWTDIPSGIVAVVWVEPSQQWAGVKPGDYIVQDDLGYFYPCERGIFERKYSPASPGVITSQNMALKRIQQGRRFGNIG